MQESEFELENELEIEGEGFLGGLLGESEFEGELEGFGETPLGEGEGEGLFELEGELEGEQFSFGKIFSSIKKLAAKAAPILKQVAKVAAPIVGTAVGGPLGGKIGSFLGNALGEGELEYEFELETEGESEAEFETVMRGPLTEQQGIGELMAAIASQAATEQEAEAQMGGAIVISLSPQDRATLKNVIPSLTRGAAVLTRILRGRQATRMMTRIVPTIVKRTAVTLKKQADSGHPITKAAAAKSMARQTRKVLSSPSICAHALQRNVNATRAVTRRTTARQAFAY